MSIIKEGDLVFVFDVGDIAAQFKHGRTLPSGVSFPSEMEKYCGNEYIVSAVGARRDHPRFYLEGAGGWVFTEEMIGLKEDDHVLFGELQISFNDIMEMR